MALAVAVLVAGSTANAAVVPRIDRLVRDGVVIWSQGSEREAVVHPGETLILEGVGFGTGDERDLAKLMFGSVRALERDLPMFASRVRLLVEEYEEYGSWIDLWPADVRSWSSTRIEVTVPPTASRGPIVVQLRERGAAIESLAMPGTSHTYPDPLTDRVLGGAPEHFEVSRLGPARESNPVPIAVESPDFAALVAAGERLFWAHDFNNGLVHALVDMDWERTLAGYGGDPWEAFGAIEARAGEVPDAAIKPHFFDPFPAPMPIHPIVGEPLSAGWSVPTRYVGYVATDSRRPGRIRPGRWIGFGCAACHTQRIVYEAEPGRTVAKVFPGLPNANWSMAWNLIGGMRGVHAVESAPGEGAAAVDKSLIIAAVPRGTAEQTLLPAADDPTRFRNDHWFSPVAMPILTRHTPMRRALSQGEAVAGFEGSYVHSQEPDGSLGPVLARPLQALTAYMSTLDRDHETLVAIGLHRSLSETGQLALIGGVGEGAFLSRGPAAFPRLTERLRRGAAIFARDCGSCHEENFGTRSNEDFLPFSEVGAYFSPAHFHRRTQAIRTAILRDLYWVAQRGLLRDGHVKTLAELVSPERCREGSPLYDRYYTLHQETFRIAKGSFEQERALRRMTYFVDVAWDAEHLYWDYQKMRREFGTREFGAPHPVALPAAPHPWCARTADEAYDLVLHLLTL